MPTACNFPRVVFVWLRRAWAARACRYANSAAVFSSNRAPTRPESHILLTTAAIAVRTWHTVNSGFFPPTLLVDLRHEPMEGDLTMRAFLDHNRLAYVIAATKADKLGRGEMTKRRRALEAGLGSRAKAVFAVSAETKSGIDELWKMVRATALAHGA